MKHWQLIKNEPLLRQIYKQLYKELPKLLKRRQFQRALISLHKKGHKFETHAYYVRVGRYKLKYSEGINYDWLMVGNVGLWPAKTLEWTRVTQDFRNGGPLEMLTIANLF